jgi:hypothetical protein
MPAGSSVSGWRLRSCSLYACANASGLARPALPSKIAAWAKDTEKVEVDRDTAIHCLYNAWAPGLRGGPGRAPSDRPRMVEVYLRVKGIKPPDYVF